MIVREFTSFLLRDQVAVVNIPTRMTWDEYDPMAVNFVMTVSDDEDITWAAYYEDVIAALSGPARVGEGDIKLTRKYRYDAFDLCLKSPDGHADIRLPVDEVGHFVDEVRSQYQDAVTCIEVALDDFLAEVLG